jgi:hypothetical protein
LLVLDQIREITLESIDLCVALKTKALDNCWVVALLVFGVEVLQVNWVHEGCVGNSDREQAYGFEVV